MPMPGKVNYSRGCLRVSLWGVEWRMRTTMVGREEPGCLSFLGTSFLKQLNETFTSQGGGLPSECLARFPVWSIPQICNFVSIPVACAENPPACRRKAGTHGDARGGGASGPLCQAWPDAGVARPHFTSSQERIWPTVWLWQELEASLSPFKSPPSFKSDPIKRLLLKEQPWHLGARLCHSSRYFQRWTEENIVSWIPGQTGLKIDLEGVEVNGSCHVAFVLFASDEAKERDSWWMVRSLLLHLGSRRAHSVFGEERDVEAGGPCRLLSPGRGCWRVRLARLRALCRITSERKRLWFHYHHLRREPL